MPQLNDLSDRYDRNKSVFDSLSVLMRDYHSACAQFNWKRAESIRAVMIETFDAGLDSTAAVFKSLETLHGKAT